MDRKSELNRARNRRLKVGTIIEAAHISEHFSSTYANARTTLEATKGVGRAFITAFCSGAVMGFLLAANGPLVLYIAINLFKLYYGQDWEGLFKAITGYGLGGSSMALFGRVGGASARQQKSVGILPRKNRYARVKRNLRSGCHEVQK